MRLLWLDDVRDPIRGNWINDQRVSEVIWVKSYDEFVDWIQKNGLPDKVSFDHDLADEHYTGYYGEHDPALPEAYQVDPYEQFTEKTGYECAKWLIEYCMDNKKELPLWAVHSFNPVGKINIKKILESYARL